MAEICCFAAGMHDTRLDEAKCQHKVAIDPATTGQGLIEGFGESIQGIVEYLGLESFVTGKTDIAGIADGMKQGADLFFLADDDQFIALDCRPGNTAGTDRAGPGSI